MSTESQKTAKKAGEAPYVPNTPIRFIAHVSRPHKLFAFAAIFFVITAQVFASLNPFILKQIVDGFVMLEDVGEQLSVLGFWGAVYVSFLAISFIFWRLSGFIGMEWMTRLNKTAYEKLYHYISFHSSQYFSDRFAGALSNKISNAADGGERMTERSLWGWFPETITVVVGFILLFTVNLYIALGFIGVLVVMIFVNLYFTRRRRPHVVAFAAASSRLRGDGVDFLTNITAARQYARRPYEIDRISYTADDRRLKDRKQWRMSEWLIVVNNVVTVLLIGGILFYLYVLFQAGSVTAGDIILVIGVLGRITHIIVFLGNMMNGFIRLYGEMQEGLEVVLEPHEVVDTPGATELVAKGGTIEWKKVSFRYNEGAVFRNFNLKIEPGQRVGLMGPSGAGKTTFVSLLLRQHDLDTGSIDIDGQNIADVTQDSLRKHIAIVPQEPALFHRSIRDNIAYGNLDASDKAVREVAKKAQAHDFIKRLPQGYDTLVGERGVKLSGGQRQRIAIARAMLKDAPILVLDEATSSLDSESEVAIQKALHELMDEKTVIAIAHRLSTLREMDRIIVLEAGKVVEDGTHHELMQNNGVYKRLWEHQAGGFLVE